MDVTTQGNPGGPSDGHGMRANVESTGATVDVSIVELFCFLCHRKDSNHAYAFSAGRMQHCFFKLLQFVLPHRYLWRERVYT